MTDIFDGADPTKYYDDQTYMDHLVFNVFGPKISKELGFDKRKIKERVRDVKLSDDLPAPATYNFLKRRINVSKDRSKSQKIVKYIGAEMGHALGGLLEDYNEFDNFSEFYDRLGQYAASRVTEGTKYQFRLDNVLDRVEKTYKISKILSDLVKRTNKMVEDIESKGDYNIGKKNIIKEAIDKAGKYFKNKRDGLDDVHTEPYTMADLLVQHYDLKDLFKSKKDIDEMISKNKTVKKGIDDLRDKISFISGVKENVDSYISEGKTNIKILEMFE